MVIFVTRVCPLKFHPPNSSLYILAVLIREWEEVILENLEVNFRMTEWYYFWKLMCKFEHAEMCAKDLRQGRNQFRNYGLCRAKSPNRSTKSKIRFEFEFWVLSLDSDSKLYHIPLSLFIAEKQKRVDTCMKRRRVIEGDQMNVVLPFNHPTCVGGLQNTGSFELQQSVPLNNQQKIALPPLYQEPSSIPDTSFF